MLGLFDSGLGGLSVWKAIRAVLPFESIVYLADTAYCPYGEKSREDIQARAFAISDFLLEKGCDVIVVACNTATTAAIESLRARYTIPFVGIEPAIKPAALHSQSGRVGVLATKGTLKGDKFKKTRAAYAKDIQVFTQVGTGLVELVESGDCDSEEAYALLHSYLEPMLREGIDQLVLGCTHYPFLINTIRKIAGPTVNVIDPSPAVAHQVKTVLERNKLISDKRDEPVFSFFTSADKQSTGVCVENTLGLSIQFCPLHL